MLDTGFWFVNEDFTMIKIALASVFLVVSYAYTQAADSKETLAMRLIAMSSFVGSTCAGMEPDMIMIGTLIRKMGVDMDALKANRGLMAQGEILISALKQMPKEGCETAWEQFGAEGKTVA